MSCTSWIEGQEVDATERWSLDDWGHEVHHIALEHGWWDLYMLPTAGMALTVDQVLAKLALVTSEVSETVEAVRNGEPHLEFRDGKPEGIGSELADVVIRVMDLCEALDIDLQRCMHEKVKYNASRPFRHGGKLA